MNKFKRLHSIPKMKN